MVVVRWRSPPAAAAAASSETQFSPAMTPPLSSTLPTAHHTPAALRELALDDSILTELLQMTAGPLS